MSDPVSKGQEAPPTPSNEAEDEKKVKVTLKVNASGGDLGVVGEVGDEVEVDAETAERWVAAGIAEKGGGAAREGSRERATERSSAEGGGRARPSGPAPGSERSVPRKADDDDDGPPTVGPTGRRS